MDIIPLVDDLEILGIFKDEDKKEGDSIITTRREVRSSQLVNRGTVYNRAGRTI